MPSAAATSEVTVAMKIDQDLHSRIKQRAAEEERSMAQTIRRALRLYLEPPAATA